MEESFTYVPRNRSRNGGAVGQSMTPESLSKEIARLSGELKRLNGLRMANAPYRVRSGVLGVFC